MGVGAAAGVGGGMGGAMGILLGSIVRYTSGSLLLDWGEDFWIGWSTTVGLDVEFAFATVVCCDCCTGLDAGTVGVIVGTLVEIPLLNTGESSGTSSIVTFGRGLVGGAEDCDGRTEVDLMIS